MLTNVQMSGHENQRSLTDRRDFTLSNRSLTLSVLNSFK